jgi:DNA-3-methyladenine glycosylase
LEPLELERLVRRPLTRAFYQRNTLEVAPDLLGKLLIARSPQGLTAGRIVETEAYQGDDPASHSAKGETPRASIMFGQPGIAYVYFIYGMYEMLNFVTEPVGQAGAVLIRAIEPVFGEVLMRRRRSVGRVHGAKPLRGVELTAGPGKLCRALGIRMADNGQRLDGPRLVVTEDPGFAPPKIVTTPRVGITAATEKPWRYLLDGNRFVSRAPQNVEKRPYPRQESIAG